MPNNEVNTTTEQTGKAKKPSIFLVSSPSGERLIRAESTTAVRTHLLGETKITKASGDDVAGVLGAGGVVEDVGVSVAHSA